MPRVVGTTTQRGYGTDHQAERQRWAPLVQAGTVTCARQDPGCIGQPLQPGQPWDLGHTDDRTAYTGPECVPCNRSAGGKAGAAASHAHRTMTIREW